MQHLPNSALVLSIAQFYIQNKSTVRDTALHFNISKSSVHNYLTIYLKNIDKSLFQQAKTLLKQNFNTKHIRGGIATRQKYSNFTK